MSLVPNATQSHNSSRQPQRASPGETRAAGPEGSTGAWRRQEAISKFSSISQRLCLKFSIYLPTSDCRYRVFLNLERAVLEEKGSQKKTQGLTEPVNMRSYTQHIRCPLFFSLHLFQSLYTCLLHCQFCSKQQ